MVILALASVCRLDHGKSILRVLLAIPVISLAAGCGAANRVALEHNQLKGDLENIPHLADDVDWVLAGLSQHTGRRLVSIHTDPEWGGTNVYERRLEENTLVCVRYTRPSSPTSRTEFVAHERYRIRNDEALGMFRNLYEQARLGIQFRSKRWGWKYSSNPGGLYLLALGNGVKLTANEGGLGLRSLVDNVQYWYLKQVNEEDIHDADLAEVFFDADSVGSVAVYLTFAVGIFDGLCDVAQLANQDKAQSGSEKSEPPGGTD